MLDAGCWMLEAAFSIPQQGSSIQFKYTTTPQLFQAVFPDRNKLDNYPGNRLDGEFSKLGEKHLTMGCIF
jgi:hypothetical protein